MGQRHAFGDPRSITFRGLQNTLLPDCVVEKFAQEVKEKWNDGTEHQKC